MHVALAVHGMRNLLKLKSIENIEVNKNFSESHAYRVIVTLSNPKTHKNIDSEKVCFP